MYSCSRVDISSGSQLHPPGSGVVESRWVSGTRRNDDRCPELNGAEGIAGPSLGHHWAIAGSSRLITPQHPTALWLSSLASYHNNTTPRDTIAEFAHLAPQHYNTTRHCSWVRSPRTTTPQHHNTTRHCSCPTHSRTSDNVIRQTSPNSFRFQWLACVETGVKLDNILGNEYMG